MLRKKISIEEVDFLDWSLGDEIQHVGAGTAEAHDANSCQFEFLGDHRDLRSTRGSIDVLED